MRVNASQGYRKPSEEYYIIVNRLNSLTGIKEHFEAPSRPGFDFYLDLYDYVYMWNRNEDVIYYYDEKKDGYNSLRQFFARTLKDRELVQEYDAYQSAAQPEDLEETWQAPLPEAREKIKNPFENFEKNLEQFASVQINSKLALLDGRVVKIK